MDPETIMREFEAEQQRRHQHLAGQVWRLGASASGGVAKPPVDVTQAVDDATCGDFSRAARTDAAMRGAAGKASADLYAAYKRLVALHGIDSDACARLVVANADDLGFIELVTRHKRAAAAVAEADRLAADDRAADWKAYRAWKATERRAEFYGRWAARGRAALGAAWWLAKVASVAGAAGYAGRLAWADLTARYFG